MLELNAGYSYHSKKGQIASLDPILWAMAKHIYVSPAWAVILHEPTFASATLRPPCKPAGVLCSQAHSLGKALSQTKRLPAAVELAARRGTHRLMFVPSRPPPPFRIWELWLLCAARGEKKNLQNDTYLWQECALEQNEAKISHSSTICKSVCTNMLRGWTWALSDC